MVSIKKRIKSLGLLKTYIKSLEPYKIVLFLIDTQKYQMMNIEILRTVIKENKFSGIYITVNRPFNVLVRDLKKSGIDTDNIFFVDCISKMIPAPKGISLQGPETIEMTKECLFIPSPTRLTEIGIALSEALNTMKNYQNKFLFLDSISTLLIYNSEASVEKFVHFLVTRLRIFGLVGIILSLEKGTNRELIATLTELCDQVVEVV